MGDLKGIVKAARALRAEDPERPLLLATVVNAAASSSRRVRGRMLIAEDRWMSGPVGDRCPQGDVVRKAWWVTRDGAPALLSYVSKGQEIDWGLGLGGDGSVDLLVEPCDVDDPFDPLAFLETCLVAETRGVVATVLRPSNRRVAVGARLQIGPDGVVRSQIADDRLAAALATRAGAVLESGRSEIHLVGGVEALVEAVVPPPHLYLFGAGFDAVPLASLAGGLGWIVTVCDSAGQPWTRSCFAGADDIRLGFGADLAADIGRDGRSGVAVVMSQESGGEREILEALLRSRARYIGVVGSPAFTERTLNELGGASDRRVHARAGLSSGAETPAEMAALAIVSEIQAMTTTPSAGELEADGFAAGRSSGACTAVGRYDVGRSADRMGVVRERRNYSHAEKIRTTG